MRTIEAACGEQGAGLVGQVAVQSAAQPQDVYGLLLGAVEEVVLDGPGDGASAIFQLSALSRINHNNKTKTKRERERYSQLTTHQILFY